MRRLVVLLLVVAGLTLVARGAIPCAGWQLQPDCYVALHPGPVENTFGLVAVDEARTYPPTGKLLLTTVLVESKLDLLEWVAGPFRTGVDQVPRERIYPPGSDREEVRQQNVALMVDSQLEATLAALRELGYEFDTDFDGARVVEVMADTAAEGRLEVGDVIVAVDGTTVSDNRGLVERIQDAAPGDEVTLTVQREGQRREITLQLGAASDDPSVAQVGVQVTSHLELPVDIAIDAGVIGGPSAGLVFALSMVELLEPGDLLGGAVVAATGTIDRDGNVGGVGGIRQKVRAASSPEDGEPASVFLVPQGNIVEAETASVERDILLVPVGTLADAVAALRAIRDGEEPVDARALSAP
ncbi:MAG: PDZ domain-containing protein [Nitriliruptorales bacterium]|nr:PDZ domain-containing protein [Nitriliruptorales bacterium]